MYWTRRFIFSFLLYSITAAPSHQTSHRLSWLGGDSSKKASQLTRHLQNQFDTSAQVSTADAVLVSIQTPLTPTLLAQLDNLMQQRIPIMLVDVNADLKLKLMKRYLPVQHAESTDSAILMMDAFQDPQGGVHYHLVHIPAGSDDIGDIPTGGKQRHIVQHIVSPVSTSISVDPAVTDARALERASNFDKLAAEVVDYLKTYFDHCGGIKPNHIRCWQFMQHQHGAGKASMNQQMFMQQVQQSLYRQEAPSMVPEDGAVWRELIETTFRFWEMSWKDPFPFRQVQTISHRLNTYWYLYLQAPPFKELYYAFVLVDGLHNPNTQLATPDAVGLYLSNLDINIHAERADREADHENVFWIRSSPKTQNTQHTIGRSWSSTDAYSMSMNLGFTGKVVSGSMNFNYTHTFTASYSESRDITDWSVVENTNPVSGTGQWRYYQQWPVDMLQHNVQDFPRVWEQYYEQSWNPCRVKDVPNLSKFALATHNSMVWAVNPRLRSKDMKQLPIRFTMSFLPKVTAHTCEVFDGHHKLAQSYLEFADMAWDVNVADLNNIQWE